jgi:branched-chain amino acid transport system substrate-binding protein
MRIRKIASALVLGAAAVAVAAGFTLGSGKRLAGDVYLGMDAPLTGPTSFVGQGDREAVDALVSYWNKNGGFKGRTVHVDVLDNASNPSLAVQNVQKFASDSKYVGILGSGNAAAAVASAPIATSAKIPFIALSPPGILVAPPRPYVYVAAPISRLFIYPEARWLRDNKVTKVAVIADNGGFGAEASGLAAKLAGTFGYEVTDRITFSPAQTDFTAELTKVKNSGAQALWVITAQNAGITITKQAKQFALPQKLIFTGASVSPQFMQGACPEMNGGIVDGSLGTVWKFLPKNHAARAPAALVEKLVGHEISTFDVDAATGLMIFKAAIEQGGFTRETINTAIETKLRGLPTPHGKLLFSTTNHSPVQIPSMWVGTWVNCKPKPQTGAAFAKRKP